MIITVSGSKGIKCQVSDFSLVVDPDKGSKADIVLRTKTEAPIVEFNSVINSEIAGAGEYEISGVRVTGIQLSKESSNKEIRTAYKVKMDEINLCFLGDLKADLSEDVLDGFGEVDILFIPSPSKDYDGKKIVSLIKQIEPKVIIPSYGEDGDKLAKELGQKPEKMEKLVIKKKELAEMNSKMIIIQS